MTCPKAEHIIIPVTDTDMEVIDNQCRSYLLATSVIMIIIWVYLIYQNMTP